MKVGFTIAAFERVALLPFGLDVILHAYVKGSAFASELRDAFIVTVEAVLTFWSRPAFATGILFTSLGTVPPAETMASFMLLSASEVETNVIPSAASMLISKLAAVKSVIVGMFASSTVSTEMTASVVSVSKD